HVFLIPAAMFALIAVHLYLIVRHGISEPPQAGRPVDRAHYRQWYDRLLHEDGVPFWPDAAWRDVVFALAVGAVVVALAILAGLGIAVLVRAGLEAPWSPDLNPSPVPAAVAAGLGQSAERGLMLFQSKGCVSCHALGGAGGHRGPNLDAVGARLSRDQLTWR